MKAGGPHESMFGLDTVTLHALIMTAAKDAGVDAFSVVPYHMMENSVPHELASGHRTLAGAQSEDTSNGGGQCMIQQNRISYSGSPNNKLLDTWGNDCRPTGIPQ